MNTKQLLNEWRRFLNGNEINERVTANMSQKLKDISDSNSDFLSQYGLQLKMESLPILIIDINKNITERDPDFVQLLKMFDEDENLRDRHEDIDDVPEGVFKRILFQWENNPQVLSSLLNVLRHFDAVELGSLNKSDVQNSSLIIFKDQGYDEDDPYSRDESSRERRIYDNAMWTLHDVMHRINEDLFSGERAFTEKSFEYLPEFSFSESFFSTVSKAISHGSDKFHKHNFSTGEDFTPSFIIFLYMYIIETKNNRINLHKSRLNLKKFLRKVYEVEAGTSRESFIETNRFISAISKTTDKILEDINIVLDKNQSIQLHLFDR